MPRWCTFIWLFSLATALPVVALAQTDQGVSPAGWKTYGPGYSRAPSASPPIQTAGDSGRTVYEQIPDDTGWLYEDMPLDRILKETFRHPYVRVEYLNWSITNPGNNILSGPTNYPPIQYPPDLIRNPTNVNQFIPTSIYSVGADPRATSNSNVNTFRSQNNQFDGGGERSVLPPVYHITNPAFTVNPNAQPPMFIATQPTTDGVQINNNSGIRGTFGFVSDVGAFEASVFSLNSSRSQFAPQQVLFLDFADVNFNNNTTEYLPTFDAVAQAILVDGKVPTQPIAVAINEVQTPANPQLPIPTAPNPLPANYPLLSQPLLRGDNFRIVYNPVLDPVTGQLVATNGTTNPATGNRLVPVYNATLKTSVWGSESNYIAPAWDGGSAIQLQPMLGFRYLNFTEGLQQSGLYTFTQVDSTTGLVTQTIQSRAINSATLNNLYGPQIGLRGEYNHNWFSFGVQPKVMMGLNSYKADLQTFQVLRPNDTNQNLIANNNTFGVVSDLQVYSRLNMTSHFSLFVAYNLLWAGNITRPADNIVYNTATLPTVKVATSEQDLRTDFKLNPQFSSTILQGVSVGGELRY